MPASNIDKKSSPSSHADDVLLLGQGREKPHSERAETAVIGAMLLDADATALAIAQLNFEGAFYRAANQILFNAIAAQSTGSQDAAVDMVVLANYLETNNLIEKIGGFSYIQTIMDSVPSAANVQNYINIVKNNAILRKIIGTCADAILQSYDANERVDELLDMIEREVLEISQMNQTRDFQFIAPLVKESLQHIMDIINHDLKTMGQPTGYDTLDKAMTGGLKPGMLFVLAARPAIGKTALALNMAANIALRSASETPVGVFSLEMSAQQLVMRLISSEARVNINRWAYTDEQSSNELQAVQEACKLLSDSKIVIDDTGGIDILELRSKARRMVEQHGVKVIFVDYLQLVTVSGNRNNSRENDVARVSGSLKALAKELNIPVVVLAQLNRAAEQGDGQPKLSNLRESGAIEQDADVVALLHRDRSEQFGQSDNAANGLEAELIIAKNRAGRNCKQMLTFFPQYTRFDAKAEEVGNDDMPD